jgi:serine/threonine protein kinase
MPVEGKVFAGRYLVKRLLGRGGMGMVYLAAQAPLDRPVALKVLRPPSEPQMDPQFYSRFLREAEAAARLQHPHTITTYDFGSTDEGVPYIVMEYLEGKDLRNALACEWPFALDRTLHIAQQVCKSVQDAHRKGMIHRDLKPSNVLLVTRDDDKDFVKVFDFGLVKFRDEDQDLTQAGVFLGSPRFTFPEALDTSVVVDHRADVYSTGILIYTMVAGQPPFSGEPMAVLSSHLNDIPRPMSEVDPYALSCPALESVVARCLRKDASDRYQSMAELHAALKEVAASLDSGELSLKMDPSHSRALWSAEFADEDSKTTQRELSIIESLPEESPSRRLREVSLFAFFVLLTAVGVVIFFFAGEERSPDSPAEAAPAERKADEKAEHLKVGVSLLSDELGLAISYMATDGRWRQLGVITEELQGRWKPSAQSPWWIAQVEPGQQVLSVLLVSPGRPGRRLELPITESRVRFDLSEESAASSEPEKTSVHVAPQGEVQSEVSPAHESDAADEKKSLAGENAPKNPKKEPSISSDYKDNPY